MDVQFLQQVLDGHQGFELDHTLGHRTPPGVRRGAEALGGRGLGGEPDLEQPGLADQVDECGHRGAVALQSRRLHQAAQPLAEGHLPQRAQQPRTDLQAETFPVLEYIHLLRLTNHTVQHTYVLGQLGLFGSAWIQVCTHARRRLVHAHYVFPHCGLIHYVQLRLLLLRHAPRWLFLLAIRNVSLPDRHW